MTLKKVMATSWTKFNNFIETLQPLGDLLIRSWVAKAFLLSGYSKVVSWSSTLLLFQYEYHVPFLAPLPAAILSVIIELGVSSLLVLGLGGRLPVLILFLFNLIAVISYPFLLTPEGYVGLKDHICWGIILLMFLLHGTGKWSLDQLFTHKKKHSFAVTSSSNP